MKFVLLAIILPAAGCMPLGTHLGAHYQYFERHGQDFVSCTVVARADRPQLATDALKICQDALSEPAPEPHK
jgi:hypothetical protein